MITTEKLNSLLSFSMVEDYWDGLSLSKIDDRLIENTKTLINHIDSDDMEFFVLSDGKGIQMELSNVPDWDLIPKEVTEGYVSIEVYLKYFTISVYDKYDTALFIRSHKYSVLK